MKKPSPKVDAPSVERAGLPLELGPAEATKAYFRRLVALLLAGFIAVTCLALYAAVVRLGIKVLLLWVCWTGTIAISYFLASAEFAVVNAHYRAKVKRRGLAGIPPLIRIFTSARYLVDRCLAAGLLILLAPALIAISFFVFIDSKGPPLVRKTKVGRFGRPFSRLTFRTAWSDEPYDERNPRSKAEARTRVTRAGKILRRTRLDTLPILFNIAKGDMAVFGNPPETPDTLLQSGPLYLPRLVLRPGFIGFKRDRDWSEKIPAGLTDAWESLSTSLAPDHQATDVEVMLIQVTSTRDRESDRRPVILSFRIDRDTQARLYQLLNETGLSRLGALTGDIEGTAALIEAAWTAWIDLPARHEDRHLHEAMRSDALAAE